jgi:hypothetical protein
MWHATTPTIYLSVSHTKGHTVFLEPGAERSNTLQTPPIAHKARIPDRTRQDLLDCRPVKKRRCRMCTIVQHRGYLITYCCLISRVLRRGIGAFLAFRDRLRQHVADSRAQYALLTAVERP